MSDRFSTLTVDEAAALDLIRDWVTIESYSADIDGCEAMLDAVAASFHGLPVSIERQPPQGGQAGLLKIEQAGDDKRLLILCHVDTVHPRGTLASDLPLRRDGDRLFGPGIYDMKGCAAAAVLGFRALIAAGGASRLPVTFLFTTDEEVGSPTSRAMIEREAARAAYVLVTEPARDGGRCVTARKGVGRYDLTVHGRPSHSGVRHQDGRSAVAEMARQILALEAMTDYARGITVNVGVVSGGTGANVVPAQCTAAIDLRVPDVAAGDEMHARIMGLKPIGPDVTLDITGGLNRPPFTRNAAIGALFDKARAVAARCGFDLQDVPMTGGGSDGNFTAVLGVPTLDGLGLDGAGAHTHQEHVLVASVVPRIRFFAGLMETLA